MSEFLNAECPECGSVYRLKPEMAGKRMRCTEAGCHAVFLVHSSPEPVGAVSTPAPTFEVAVSSYETEAPAPVFDWRNEPPPPIAEAPRNVPPPPRPVVIPAPLPWIDDAKPSRIYRRFVVLALLLFVVGCAFWGIASLIRNFARAEDRMVAAADKAFTDKEFNKAATRYLELAEQYPRSVRVADYRFRADLAKVLRAAGMVPPTADEALVELERFVAEQRNGPYLSAHRLDIYEASLKTFADLAVEAGALLPNNVDAAEERTNQVRRAWDLVAKNAPSGEDTSSARGKLDNLVNGIARERSRAAARAEALRLLNLSKPDLETAGDLIRRGGFTDDPEIRAAWQRAEENLRTQVAYRTIGTPAQPGTKISSRGIFPGPIVVGTGPRLSVLACGLLASIDARTGRVGWVDRLGIDATISPTPLPSESDKWLVVSAEPVSLSLRDAVTGQSHWVQPLDAMPVGPPAVVNGRAYLAFNNGFVFEFDARSGVLIGSFSTQKPLAGGIAVLPGKARLVVPALSQQLYVLDTIPDDGPPRCLATLTTGHTAGSLRRAPDVFPLPDGGYGLLLELADGLADTSLELYRLPENSLASLVPLDRIRVTGWTANAPARLGDRIAAAGDRGLVAALGLKQPGASDPPLFPLTDGPLTAGPSNGSPRRSFAVWDQDALITLSGGQLRQWRLVIDRTHGRRLAPGWAIADSLGAAIQAPTLADGIITAVTQRSDPPATMITAVRTATGELLWQRTFGFCASYTVNLNGHAMMADPRGAVLVVAPSEVTGEGWSFAGREIAGPVLSLAGRATLQRNAAGDVAMVATTLKGIAIRRFSNELGISEQVVELPAAPQGQPAITRAAALVPLTNGQLMRLVVGNSKPTPGPTWRAAGAGPDATGSVTWWHDDTYLVHDGNRKLASLRWGDGTDYEMSSSPLERPRRLLGQPVIIPGDVPRAAVIDAGNNVLLLRGDRLEIEQNWRLGDGPAISSGPANLAGLIMLVRGQRELVALRPGKDEPAWHFTPSGADIVGEPVEAGGAILLADTMGRLWKLDPQTGKPALADGYQLPSSLVAGSCPVPLGNDRLYVPLVDGTAIAVRLDELAGEAK